MGPSEDSTPQPKLAKIRTMSDEIDDGITGGLGAVREVDDEVNEVMAKVKPMFEEASGKKFETLEVIHYKTQVVAGRNYFVKAKAKETDGREQIVHLRIWQKLNGELELTAHQLDRQADEELQYFQ